MTKIQVVQKGITDFIEVEYDGLLELQWVMNKLNDFKVTKLESFDNGVKVTFQKDDVKVTVTLLYDNKTSKVVVERGH